MDLQLAHIAFSHAGRQPRTVLKDVSFTVSRGESLLILGGEGSGKTTLLELLDGLAEPTGGWMRFDGATIDPFHPMPSSVRRRIAYAFQFPAEQFFLNSVSEEIRFALSRGFEPPDALPAASENLMAEVGLDPRKYSARSPFSLSVGEARRLSLALILAANSDMVLLDEPFAGSDAAGVALVRSVMERARHRGAVVITTSLDSDFAADMVTRCLVLERGVVVHDVSPEALARDAGLSERFKYG